MLLAIDIGNTIIHLALMKDKRIVKRFSIETRLSSLKLKSELKGILKQVKKKDKALKNIIICSVVPKTLKVVERKIQKICKLRPQVIGRDIRVPIANRYFKPQEVGQDRLVGAYGVKMLYGYPAIVIDFGTAITFDVVSKKGAYEGGMIVSGIRLSAESLFHKTALLPRIDRIKAPRHLVGKTTQESILSGIFHGYGAMCDGLIKLISLEIKGRPKVILTGGYTDLVRKFISQKNYTVDNDLVFKGLSLLLKRK